MKKKDAVILFPKKINKSQLMLEGIVCHCYSVLAHLHLKHDPSGF